MFLKTWVKSLQLSYANEAKFCIFRNFPKKFWSRTRFRHVKVTNLKNLWNKKITGTIYFVHLPNTKDSIAVRTKREAAGSKTALIFMQSWQILLYLVIVKSLFKALHVQLRELHVATLTSKKKYKLVCMVIYWDSWWLLVTYSSPDFSSENRSTMRTKIEVALN